MNLIKYMLLVVVALGYSNCNLLPLSEEDYLEQCPYERRYGGRSFYLEAPIVFAPKQPIYEVGDTITVTIELDDEVMDLSRQMDFKITDFPFQPFFHLYHIKDNEWQSGIGLNEVIIDSIYQPRIVGQSTAFSSSLRGSSSYIANNYKFQFDIVMNHPGRYVTYVVDKSSTTDTRDETNPEYLNVVNDSGCPNPAYEVSYIVEQDRHLDEYLDEFIFLDREVYRGAIYTFDEENYPEFDVPGDGSILVLEWSGMYGFEVVE